MMTEPSIKACVDLACLCLSQLCQFTKDAGIVDSNVGQHFAVDLDIGQLQAMNELAVIDTIDPGGRIDAGDPQATEVALAITSIAKSVKEGLEHGLIGTAEKAVLGAKLPFGEL